jgi:hypothetical protein
MMAAPTEIIHRPGEPVKSLSVCRQVFSPRQEPVGEFRRRPESEPFFRLIKTAKQAMFILSSIQPDAVRRTAAAAFILQFFKTVKENGPLEARSNTPTRS